MDDCDVGDEVDNVPSLSVQDRHAGPINEFEYDSRVLGCGTATQQLRQDARLPTGDCETNWALGDVVKIWKVQDWSSGNSHRRPPCKRWIGSRVPSGGKWVSSEPTMVPTVCVDRKGRTRSLWASTEFVQES